MDHGLINGPLYGKTMSRLGSYHEVHLAPMGHYNYPIHPELEYPGRAPSRWAAKLQALQERDSPKSKGPGE